MTALIKKRSNSSAAKYITASTSPDETLILEAGFQNHDSLENLTRKLPNLKHIIFDACYDLKSKDIEYLAQLTNLTNLEIDYCSSLENIDFLADLSNLTHLRITNVYDKGHYRVLSNLINLTHLEIGENDGLKNIDFLSDLTNLVHLDLNFLYVLEDIYAVSNLSKLTHLILNNSAVKNIDFIVKLPNLRFVDVTGCDNLKNIDTLRRMDNFNGKSSIKYLSGFRYEGDWANCRIEGFGKFRCPQYSYEGYYKDGIKEGKGTEIQKDGTKYEGYFHKNSYHGKGIITYPNGEKSEVEFDMGQKKT